MKRVFNDWICKGCDELLFGRKGKCYKCQPNKNGNSLTINKNNISIDTTNVPENDHINKCFICMEKEINALFIHREDGRRSCCHDCAKDIFNSTKKMSYV